MFDVFIDSFGAIGSGHAAILAFFAYWAVLVGVALLEVAAPGRPVIQPAGRRIVVNFALGAMVEAVLIAPNLINFAVARFALHAHIGLCNLVPLGAFAKILIGFVILDMVDYAFHRASHEWPVLWRLHRVHHTDTDMDLSSLFRGHPGTMLVAFPIDLAVVVLIGIHPAALLVYNIAKLTVMALAHANLAARPRLGRVVAQVFVTPAYHAVHHSADPQQTDTNYGAVLTIWDKLFGTHSRIAGPIRAFGLGQRYDGDADNLLAQLRLPLMPPG